MVDPLGAKSVADLFEYILGLFAKDSQLQKSLRTIGQAGIFAANDTPSQVRKYFAMERLIADAASSFGVGMTAQALRQGIAQNIPLDALPKDMSLIFLPPESRKVRIYVMALNRLLAYMVDHMNGKTFSEAIQANVSGTPLESVVQGSGVNETALRERSKEPGDKHLSEALGRLYRSLGNLLSDTLGEAIFLDAGRQGYDFFKKTYDAEITAEFLSILPEGILETERLAHLSRGELEKKVQERTLELKKLNDELEERVQARTKDLTEANKHLMELDKVKSEFLSVAAHQLRTPLTGIMWALGSLSRTTLPEQEVKILDKAVISTKYVIRLVGEFLDVTRIEGTGMQVVLTKQSLTPLLQEIAESYVSTATSRKIDYQRVLPTNPLPEQPFDADKIKIALGNLIDNAFIYSREGGSVNLTVESREGETIIKVSDTGIGIPQADAHRIYSKFYRSQTAIHFQTQGTGLGLYVTKKIIEMHGGSVSYQSEEGKGTTFTVVLPLNLQIPPPAQTPDPGTPVQVAPSGV